MNAYDEMVIRWKEEARENSLSWSAIADLLGSLDPKEEEGVAPTMNSADVVGYSFEADTHCLSCTEARFPGTLPVSEYFDSEGNTPFAIFSDEARNEEYTCGSCGWRLDGEDNSIYTITELTEGAIDREEFFPRYQEARATFELWTKEAREFNNSDGDGVFFWDTALCRMVAEYTGHNGDGGSLVEFGV